MAFPSNLIPAIHQLILVVDPSTTAIEASTTQPSTTQPHTVKITEADRHHGVDHAEAAKAKMLVALSLILALILITSFGYILIRRVIRQWRMQESLRDRMEKPVKATVVTDPWKVSAERMATPGESGDAEDSDDDEPEDDRDLPHGH